MWRIETGTELTAVQRTNVARLLTDVEAHDGFRPLSDQLWLDFTAGSPSTFFAAWAVDGAGQTVGYAQLARLPQSSMVELVVSPGHRHDTALTTLLLRTLIDHVAELGGGPVHWWVFRPDVDVEPIATAVGLHPGRRLLQLRRPLPLDEVSTLATRAFRVGSDEAQWLRVNNAAFADHPEQGGWTEAMLRRRQGETWFDADGVRLHERDGRLAAFCWTKVHDSTDPPMGEIYVIAVDPSLHGLGLGRAMTIAGLEHLAEHGLTVAMLYVDESNSAAMALYQRLGFTTHHADHAYVGNIPAARTEQTA
jgi:mycothiol synthase